MSYNVSYYVSCNVSYNASYNVSYNVLYNVLYHVSYYVSYNVSYHVSYNVLLTQISVMFRSCVIHERIGKSYSCIFFETPCWLLSNPRNKQIGFDNFYETPCSTIFKSILQVKPVIFLALLRIQYGSKCVAISRMC